jgi:hypothetical protein
MYNTHIYLFLLDRSSFEKMISRYRGISRRSKSRNNVSIFYPIKEQYQSSSRYSFISILATENRLFRTLISFIYQTKYLSFIELVINRIIQSCYLLFTDNRYYTFLIQHLFTNIQKDVSVRHHFHLEICLLKSLPNQ